MSEKIVSEILLTSKFVTEESWLKLIYEVSKLNGRLRKWDLLIKIELNTVRYFIQSSRQLPSVISHLSDFLLKRVEGEEKSKVPFRFFYVMSNQERNILDVYDKNEVKKSHNLNLAQITIWPYCKTRFLYTTNIVLENKQNKMIK